MKGALAQSLERREMMVVICFPHTWVSLCRQISAGKHPKKLSGKPGAFGGLPCNLHSAHIDHLNCWQRRCEWWQVPFSVTFSASLGEAILQSRK